MLALALIAGASAAFGQVPAPSGEPAESTPAEPAAAAAKEVPATAEPPRAAVRMTVDEAIDAALARNFGLRLSRNDLAAGQSSLRAAANAFDFKLTAAFEDGHAYQRNGTVLTPVGTVLRDYVDEDQRFSFILAKDLRVGGNVQVRTDMTRGTVASVGPTHESATTVSWTIPLWSGRGKRVTTAGLVSAEVGLRQQARSLVEREMQVVVAVVRAFYQVLRSDSVLKIDREAVARAEDNYRTFGLRLEEGLVTPIDVARSERELKDRQNAVVTDEEALQAARDQLLQLLGIELDTRIDATGEPVFARVDADLDSATREAMQNRADLRAQRENVELALLDVDVARSGTKPQIDLTLAAGFSSVAGDEAGKWFDIDDDDRWAGGLGVSYTFGERADNETLARALMSADSAKLRLTELERQIVLEVRDAVRNVRSLERQVALLEDNVRLATESLRLAQLQLKEDLIGTTDLLQIQDELVRAETSRINALYDHAAAMVSLDLALGRYRVLSTQPRRSEFLKDEPSVEPDVPVLPRVQLSPGEPARPPAESPR